MRNLITLFHKWRVSRMSQRQYYFYTFKKMSDEQLFNMLVGYVDYGIENNKGRDLF